MTLDEVNADLDECAAFDNPPDVDLARRYIVAARIWLRMAADSSSNQSSSMTIGKQHVADMMKYAQAFVSANSSTGDVLFLQPGRFFR
jgi:hypothetical protein